MISGVGMWFNKFLKRLSLSLMLSVSAGTFADVQVDNAWVRLLPPMSKMTAAYMNLKSDQDDRLLAASSELARYVEIHQSKMLDGMMSMQEVDALSLPKDQTVELKPQSYHLMVMGLYAPLKEGDEHIFILEFEKAGKLEVKIPVRNP